jgi:hypothetical protein
MGSPARLLILAISSRLVDPFTWHMLSAWSLGSSFTWATTLATLADSKSMDKLAESFVGDHLRRMSGARMYY